MRTSVLVAFAVTDGSPSHTRVGKLTSVPPPAIELIIPAVKAAAKAASAWRGVKAGSTYFTAYRELDTLLNV
jgi:hypothetical protein